MVLAAQQSCKSYQQCKQRHRYKQRLFRHGAPFGPRGSPIKRTGANCRPTAVAHLLNNLAFAMWRDGKGSPKRRSTTSLAIMAGKVIVDDGQTVTEALGLVNAEGLVLPFLVDTSQPVVS